MSGGGLDFSGHADAVDSLDFSDHGTPVEALGAGETAKRGFVKGGGALLNALDTLGGAMDTSRMLRRAMGEPNELGDLAKSAEEYGTTLSHEIPADLTARVTGGGAQILPELAAAIGTSGETLVPEAATAAARSVPYAGRFLEGIVHGAPVATTLTGIQAADLPDTMTPEQKVLETLKAGGLNLAMAGLPVAAGEAPLVRMMTGAGIGAGTSAGISAVQGQDQDAASNIIGALMGAGLGATPHGAPSSIEDMLADLHRNSPTPNTGRDLVAPEPARAAPVDPNAPIDAEFTDTPRLAPPDAAPLALPAPEQAADLVRMLTGEGQRALPAPVTTVDSAGTARTSDSITQEIMDAIDAAKNKRDLGITPGTERNLARIANSEQAPELTQQGADDAPPWWLAGQHAQEVADAARAEPAPVNQPSNDRQMTVEHETGNPVSEQKQPVAEPATPPTVKQSLTAESSKAPWEMTGDEWRAAREAIRPNVAQSNFTRASGSEAVARERERTRLTDGVADDASQKMKDAVAGKIKLSPDELDALTERLQTPVSHRDVVEKALRDGKVVPPKVLAEYPDLAGNDTPDAPLDIRYGKRRLPAKLEKTDARSTGVEAVRDGGEVAPLSVDGARAPEPVAENVESARPDVAELSDDDLTPAERAAFERQQAPRELSTADLTESERAAFDRQSEKGRGEDQKFLSDESRRVGEQDADRLGLRSAVDDILGGAQGAPKVEFVRDEDALPEGTKLPSVNGRKVRREGTYDPNTGRVHIFTDTVHTPERAAWVAAHEIAGHHGLRGLIAERAGAKVGSRDARAALDNALDIARQNPTIVKLADAIGKQRKSDNPRLMAEEALAELAAATRTGRFEEIADKYGVDVPEGVRGGLKSAVARFVERIKQLLAKVFRKARFSDAQVHELIEGAFRYVKKPRGGEKAAGDAVEATSHDQTETPAFKRWFGESKVVDAHGVPQVVYHGTAKEFTRFDPKRSIGGLHWFTTDKAAVERRDVGAQGHGHIIDAYLSIKKPAGWKEYDKFTIDQLEREGYDGLKLPDSDGQTTYVAFDPKQIKSASRNNGKFDPDSASIRESTTHDESLESVTADDADIPRSKEEGPRLARRPGESQRQYANRVMRKDAAEVKTALSVAKRDQAVARGTFRGILATRERNLAVATRAFAEARKMFDETPTDINLASIDAHETGKPILDADARAFFKLTDDAMAERIDKGRKLDPDFLPTLTENYFPHFYKDDAKAGRLFATFTAKRPLGGDRGFLKERKYPTLKEAMATGLQPISDNPVDFVMFKVAQMDKYIGMLELADDLKKRGLAVQADAEDRIPDGLAAVDDRAFEKVVRHAMGGTDKGVSSKTRILVPELIARDLNNYLTPALDKFGAWRGLRTLQNTMVSAKLGWSAFHAGFTTIDNSVMHTDIAMRQLANGHPLEMLKTLAGIATAPYEGGRLAKNWRGELAKGQKSIDPDTHAILLALENGGARLGMSSTEFNDAIPQLVKRWRQRGLGKGDDSIGGRVVPGGQAIKDVGTLLKSIGEASSYLIHKKLVPAQKMSARVMLLKHELDRFSGELGKKHGDYAGTIEAMHPDTLTEIAGYVVDLVDFRLGQMAYDNRFWNKAILQLAQTVFMAPGWQAGTLQTVFGGVKGLKNLTHPTEFRAPLDKAGTKKGTYDRFDLRLSNMITLALLVGGGGALLQYLATGITPKDRDYFLPRTGGENPDGSDTRMQPPSYWQDHYKLGNAVGSILSDADPSKLGEMVAHKTNPLFSEILEAIRNKDYFGTQVFNPKDSVGKRAADVAKHLAEGFLPMSVSNSDRMKDSGPLRKAAGFVGFAPASAANSRSDFENFVTEHQHHGGDTKTQAQQDAYEARRDAEDALRAGKEADLSKLTPKQRKSVEKAARMSVPEKRFSSLSFDDKLDAWDIATPEEREQYNLGKIMARINPTKYEVFNRASMAEKRAFLKRLQAIVPNRTYAGDEGDQ